MALLADGTWGEVDPVKLTDADGRSYLSVSSAGQASDGDDFVATVEVLPIAMTELTEEDREADFLSTHDPSELDAFRARRARDHGIPEIPFRIEPELSAWAADGEGTVEVVVVLREQIGLDVPAAGLGPDASPLLDLQLQEERLLALESHETAVLASQAELVALVEDGGGEVVGRNWLVNRFFAVVSPELLAELADRDDVARIEFPAVYQNDANTGDVIRHKTQVEQYLDEGFDGSVPSGRNPATNMLVGVIDTTFDEDHPGWNDRRYRWRIYDGAPVNLWRNGNASTEDSATAAAPNTHGGMVTSALIADLTQGQDPSLSALQRSQRTGTTTESSLVFFQCEEALTVSRGTALDDAAGFELDVLNMSRSCSGPVPGGQPTSCVWCDVDSSENEPVDTMYHLGVFTVNTGGNYWASDGGCYVAAPGTAAGSFTPGAVNATGTADLNTAALRASSSGGIDVHGRKMIDLAAPGQREDNTTLMWNNAYSTGGAGTSIAAPHVAGAAANLKHLLIDVFGTTTPNVVGNLYANMLLMGDLANGATTFGSSIDSRWGAGRMRMRMWDPAGMDAPHRMRFGGTPDKVRRSSWCPPRLRRHLGAPSRTWCGAASSRSRSTPNSTRTSFVA